MHAFARRSTPGHQLLVIQDLSPAEDRLAETVLRDAIVPAGTPSNAVRWIEMSRYPRFFVELGRCFDDPPLLPHGGGGGGPGIFDRIAAWMGRLPTPIAAEIPVSDEDSFFFGRWTTKPRAFDHAFYAQIESVDRGHLDWRDLPANVPRPAHESWTSSAKKPKPQIAPPEFIDGDRFVERAFIRQDPKLDALWATVAGSRSRA